MGILKFPLPEEIDAFNYALKGIDYSIVLDDLDQWLRSKSKYEDIETITIEEVRGKLWELKSERNLE
jgi:hypothetical protein